MIGRSHSGDRAFMLLLVLRSFFPVPGNFIAPTPPSVLTAYELQRCVQCQRLPMKIQVLHSWFVIGRPSAGRGGNLWSRFTPPPRLLLTASHKELHRFCCHINSCTCEPARAQTASVNPQFRLCRNHIWWDRRSDRQPARRSLLPSDLFQGICKVTGFHQGNQLERALVECLTIPPCFPGRWRSLLVNIISLAVVLDGAALYRIRAKAYQIPFSTGKVIFPTSMISEHLISKVGL